MACIRGSIILLVELLANREVNMVSEVLIEAVQRREDYAVASTIVASQVEDKVSRGIVAEEFVFGSEVGVGNHFSMERGIIGILMLGF